MCGISGFTRNDKDIGFKTLKNMLRTISSRGPDDEGFDMACGTYVGMRRLSIIDIKKGNQPIFSNDGRFSIVFNGEIYNYRDINKMLKINGREIKTNSDTESILNGYLEWGPNFIKKLRGVFAFAILDHNDGSLFLARDRMGVKPLYYYHVNGQLIFSSEIKSIIKHPEVKREINYSKISEYFILRYVPGPETLINNILKFPPANYAILKNGTLTFHKYWETEKIEKWQGDFNEAQEKFNDIFDESCELRMLSERPVGAFLSGGLDSTAIVSSLSKKSKNKLKTFSVGFDWAGDENKDAQKVANILGTDHECITCDLDITKNLPKILWHLDEPIGDGIILPMYALAKAASRKVTVVQSGEGADEILAGYFTHKIMHYGSKYNQIVPNVVQDQIKNVIKMVPSKLINNVFDYPGELGESGKNRLIDFLEMLQIYSKEFNFKFLISLFTSQEINELIKKPSKTIKSFKAENYKSDSLNSILKFQFNDWLPDDILSKLDKITMANSLEGRVPFMDHKLVEFLTSLPGHYKLHLGRNKILLRNYLKQTSAFQTSFKKKVPFYIPIDRYLSNEPLNSMIKEFLNEKSIKKRGILNWKYIENLLNQTNEHGFINGKQIFSILTFELWCRIYIDNEFGWI